MKPIISAWALAGRLLVQRYRNRLPLLLLTIAVLTLAALVVPAEQMPWERWVLLIASLTMLVVCLDFNTMIWRIYRKRGDLQSVRFSLGLLGGFIALLALGRLVGFASLFFPEALALASIVNLAGAFVASVLVVKSQNVEEYAVGVPKIADLAAAHRERNEAIQQLAIREKNALEGMTILSDDTITEANPEAYRIFGYDAARHELIGMRAHQLVHEDDSKLAYQALRAPHSDPYLIRIICKDGSIKQVESTGTTMMRHEVEVRVVNFRDVTFERRYLQLIGVQIDDCADPNSKLIKELADARQYFHVDTTDKTIKPLSNNAQ